MRNETSSRGEVASVVAAGDFGSILQYAASYPLAVLQGLSRCMREAYEGWLLAIALPLAMLLLTTLIIWNTGLDLLVARQFYGCLDVPWPARFEEPWNTIRLHGEIPGVILGTMGITFLVLSLWLKQFSKNRPAWLFLSLAFVLGPGILVNAILKPNWMRPRPNQIVTFGGAREFVPVWGMGNDADCKSFPCGHASVGFFLTAPAFLILRRRRTWAILCLSLGFSAGSFIGVARIVQGGHFLSDVIWSAGIIYLTNISLFYALKLHREPPDIQAEIFPFASRSMDDVTFHDASEQEPSAKAA